MSDYLIINKLMNPRERFKSLLPESVYLDLRHQDELAELLYKNSWIRPDDKVLAMAKPGEGNMNFVVRVKTNSTSIIVKQSRPWVEKYPQIDAPASRIFVEAAFYNVLMHDSYYNSLCPSIIGFDAKNFLLALEDLGEGADCTFIYERDSTFEDTELFSLIDFVSHLHNTPLSDPQAFPGNAELKILNHTHIFHYPYLEDNGFDLDTIQPGLQHIAMHYKTDAVLKKHLKDLGDVYLQTGSALIHGDYYPGSWLKTKDGIKIIDPEFSHLGSPEFDIGVMMANLKMAQLEHKLKQAWGHYKVPAVFSVPLMLRFCGVEIMRRVIGLAQLPLHLRLQEKSEILELAAQLIQNPKEHLLFQD